MKFVCWSVCLVILVAQSGCSKAAATPAPRKPATRGGRPCVVLAGDSLVSETVGWGGAFATQVKSKDDVINAAAGGQGSSSYLSCPQWKRALRSNAGLVLLELGTNDSPAIDTRHPATPDVFGKNLAGYVNDARGRGMAIILVTPLARRTFDGQGHIVSDLSLYAQAVNEVAQATHTPVIDLHAWSVTYFQQIGETEVLAHSPRDKRRRIDSTHLAPEWQSPVAAFVVQQMRTIDPNY